MTITEDNSYLTLEEAAEYYSGRLGSDIWKTLEDTQKEQALRTATKRVDMLPFIGYKMSPNQPLQFPRVYYDKECYLYGVTIANMPQQVKDATAEEALTLVQYLEANGEVAFNGVTANNYQSLKLGDATISYNDGKNSTAYTIATNQYGLLSDEAAKLLQGLIKVGYDIRNPEYKEVY